MNTNKKKLIVIAVLGTVLLGVGVFQFASSGQTQTPPPPATTKNASPNGPGASPSGPDANAGIPGSQGSQDLQNVSPDDPIRMLYAQALPQRDPFKRGAAELEGLPSQVPQSQIVRPLAMRPSMLPPFPIPGISPTLSGPGGTNVGVQPGAPIRQPGEFAYKLSGVILGVRPAAIFTDDSGNQKLVLLGGSLDGDNRLVGLARGQATVNHNGKNLTMAVCDCYKGEGSESSPKQPLTPSVGGNPNAN